MFRSPLLRKNASNTYDSVVANVRKFFRNDTHAVELLPYGEFIQEETPSDLEAMAHVATDVLTYLSSNGFTSGYCIGGDEDDDVDFEAFEEFVDSCESEDSRVFNRTEDNTEYVQVTIERVSGVRVFSIGRGSGGVSPYLVYFGGRRGDVNKINKEFNIIVRD